MLKIKEKGNYPVLKRSEITFGYLTEQLHHCAVNSKSVFIDDLGGSFTLLDEDTVYQRMMDLDDIFVGVRRSVIDHSQHVRQLIQYTLIVRLAENDELEYGVYVRGNGADARLSGALSIGFGGHLDATDVASTEQCGSHAALVHSGYRELKEEVSLHVKHEESGVSQYQTVELSPDNISDPIGFISDYRPETENWVGNTHLGVLAYTVLPHGDSDFEMLEPKYDKFGWYTKSELKEFEPRLENWTALVLKEIDALEKVIRNNLCN